VISLGYPADEQAWLDRVSRIYVGADRRLAWSSLFFEDTFDQPLGPSQAEIFKEPLELVRLGPSASNKQPWRILHRDDQWHFYIQRSTSYSRPVIRSLLGFSDLQRIDLGIAMAHFDLGAREQGLNGSWSHSDPGIADEGRNLEYNVSWSSH
jgi:hypothetical protein